MLIQFIKYNLVGIVNTLSGFSIVFSLMLWGVSPVLSNFIGYAVGSVVSYYLNSRYTFKTVQNNHLQVVYFFLVLLFSYLLNFLTLRLLLELMNPYLAQLLSAIVYTLSSFLLMKFFVFRDRPV